MDLRDVLVALEGKEASVTVSSGTDVYGTIGAVGEDYVEVVHRGTVRYVSIGGIDFVAVTERD